MSLGEMVGWTVWRGRRWRMMRKLCCRTYSVDWIVSMESLCVTNQFFEQYIRWPIQSHSADQSQESLVEHVIGWHFNNRPGCGPIKITTPKRIQLHLDFFLFSCFSRKIKFAFKANGKSSKITFVGEFLFRVGEETFGQQCQKGRPVIIFMSSSLNSSMS